jgi:hypothetical protein
MSMAAPPLVMTINDRQKCFEERKQLESHACSGSHYVTLGVVSIFYCNNLYQWFFQIPILVSSTVKTYIRERVL